MSTQPRAKPVALQVNSRGSWANVIGFDAVDTLAYANAIDAAETLGKLHHGQVSFRIVTEHQPPLALMRWTASTGWKKVDHAD